MVFSFPQSDGKTIHHIGLKNSLPSDISRDVKSSTLISVLDII